MTMNMAKLVVVSIAVLSLVSTITPAQMISGQNKAAVSEKTLNKPYSLTFSENDFIFDKIMGYDRVTLTDGGYLTTIGKPMLPVKTIRIALPADMKATMVRIVSTQEQILSGTYIIFPAQPPQPTNTISDNYLPFSLDIQTYLSRDVYPSQYVELLSETDLAGQAMAVVNIYPVHYIANQQQLILLKSIAFVIEGTNGYLCGDYLSTHLSDTVRQMNEAMVRDMVVNPEDVNLRVSETPQPMGVSPGDYDYVIITQSSWVSAFQPLADWKTQKGLPATIVTTAWIYSTYSGSNNVDKIRAFVIDANTNWGTTFFLLGGDTGIVPYNSKTFPSVDYDPVPNDTYYSDFDNDYVCEVHVGRASVVTTGTGNGGIGGFINKIFTYEKNPPLTSYAKKAGFFGFDLDSSTPAEQCKIAIRQSYVPIPWIVTTVYDSQTGNHKTNVIAAINAGQNLLNHCDHSSWDYMGTGYVNHNWGLENGDMDALTNGNKQGIFYSMGCDPAAYDNDNCIAEHFVRNINGGGIAFAGNSRYGWYNYGSYNTYSMLYDQKFFYSLFTQNNYKLGATFSGHKNDYYPNDDYYKYIFTELTLLGDPELPVWKDNPISLTATYPSELPLGASSFTVHVTSGSNPLNQAYVCLWKGTEVYLTGSTNSGGDVTFTPSPTTTGTMYVTVTKQNYLPYEGSATVIQGNNPPNTPDTPSGPVKGIAGRTYTYTTQTIDPDGDQVYYLFDWGDATTSGWIGPTISGTIVSVPHTWTSYGLYNIQVKAKDEHNAESGWSTLLQVRMYRIGDTSGDDQVNFGDINPFVLMLTEGEAAYDAQFPNGYYYTGDVNQDDSVNTGDINPFVALLTGG